MLGCKGPGEAKDTNIVELSEKVFEKVLKNILNFPQNLKWDSRTPGGGAESSAQKYQILVAWVVGELIVTHIEGFLERDNKFKFLLNLKGDPRTL